MDVIRIKLGNSTEFFEYETLEDIKKYFDSEECKSIALTTLGEYDSERESKRILVDELTLSDVNWAQGDCAWGSRYLRGYKSMY